MSTKDYVPYDFRKAGLTDETAAAMKIWITKTSYAIVDTWRSFSAAPAAISLARLNTETFASATELVDGNYVGAIVEFNGGTNESIWTLAPKDVHLLIAEFLGLPDDAQPPERAVTSFEQDLCEKFFHYLIQALAENFPGSDAIPGRMKETLPNPKRVRLFRSSDTVTTTHLIIKLPRGDVMIQWILPKQNTVEMLSGVVDRRAKPKKESGDPREVVERVPVEIVGVLGEMTLSLNQLSTMKAGDVFVLNQKIDQPLIALVDGKPFYECWPGKIGSTQGLEISTCL